MFREIILGYPFFQTKDLIKKSEFWSSEKLKNLQRQLLGKILKYAINNVPYYCDKMDMARCDHKDDPFETLKLFPIIDTEEIKGHLKDLIKKRGIRAFKATTGGSTGQPFVFYLDRFTSRQKEKAFMFDQWSRVGYKFGDRIFNLRGRTPKNNRFIHHDRLFNIYSASSFNLKSATIKQYVDKMNSIQPLYLHGYPSTMYQLANLIEKAFLKLKTKPKAVFCGSEKLFLYQRSIIEKVFGCRVYSWYGTSEYLVLGGECEYSQSLHLYPQYGYTELFPTGKRDSHGKDIFEIVATGFNNFVMPLIRYRTGDYAVKSEVQKCECGRNYLLLDEVIGRGQEFVVDINNDLVSALALFMGAHFEIFNGLEAFQLRQSQPGEIEYILVKNSYFSEKAFKEMKDRINKIMGNRMRIYYTFKQHIPKTPIGKSRLVDQKLNIQDYF